MKGLSENIEVVSIVGRFLEHARVFHFHNGGEDEVFLASTDWMPRTLDWRIELMFPVDAPDCRCRVIEALDLLFRDNVKGRRHASDGAWRVPARHGSDPPRVAQAAHYDHARGCEQRDESVRVGAIGATTLVVRESKVLFPGDDNFPDQESVAPLKRMFDTEDGDVIIIGSAFSYEAAEKGAVTAALAIGNQSRRCWTEGTTLLSADTEADDLKCIALAMYELVGRLPLAMWSKNQYGVRCEDGEVVDSNYTGPVLEEALKKSQIIRRTAVSGLYRGVPVVVVPGRPEMRWQPGRSPGKTPATPPPFTRPKSW